MLSVAKLARGREAYYLETVAAGREGTGVLAEPDGRWLGRAAATLGLDGTVEGAQLTALFAGADPLTGEILSPYHARVRVVAYDCTYSTPKSVSVLHALGEEEIRTQVRAGHEQAAAAALGYLERSGARVRRRLAPGQAASPVPAGGFVAAAFLHRTSRAPDPHLHSHVLVANLAPGPDGRWSALDARGLFLELGTARDLYETQLRCELTGRLGVTWRELQGAWADLAGIDPGVRRAFSRRSEDIAAALERAGRSGPRAAHIASVKTRPRKDLGTSYEKLVETWRERSYRLGVSDARIAAVAGRSLTAGAETINEVDPGLRPEGRWAAQALGEHGVTARDGTCRRGDLVRARCASLPSGASVEDIEREVEGLLADGRVVEVPVQSQGFGRVLKKASRRGIPAGVAEPVYTTPAVLRIHERLVETVREHPETVRLLAYRPGGRLGALDAISAASKLSGSVSAVAPGRAAAASFEAVTGIETTAVGDMAPASDWAGEVVVAEAHRMGPWELSSIVESSTAAGGRTVLLAPWAALGDRFVAAATIAPYLAHFAPTGSFEVSPARGSQAGAPERYCFAEREVLVVEDGAGAREALVKAWLEGRASGQRPVLVASDDAVVASLRASVRDAGGSPDDVVEARRLAARLAAWRAGTGRSGQILVLGALPNAVRGVAPGECVHVAIVSPEFRAGERLGRAAEVARPRYLVSELGTVRSRSFDRSAWRAGARVIETFRQRFAIDDHERAVGDPRALRSLGHTADVADTRLELGRLLRTMESETPSIPRRARESPGLSR